MDVIKTPPPELGTGRKPEGTAPPPAGAAPMPQSLETAASEPSAAADRLALQSLPVEGALQILMAEVRAEFGLPGAWLPPGALLLPGGAQAAPGVPQAARWLIQLLLEALPPEIPDRARDASVVAATELAFRSALDRAQDVIVAWRDVRPTVVEAADQARAQALSRLGDDAFGLDPEWLVLAAGLADFRRRRKRRRGIGDPDWRPSAPDPSAPDDGGGERTR